MDIPRRDSSLSLSLSRRDSLPAIPPTTKNRLLQRQTVARPPSPVIDVILGASPRQARPLRKFRDATIRGVSLSLSFSLPRRDSRCSRLSRPPRDVVAAKFMSREIKSDGSA